LGILSYGAVVLLLGRLRRLRLGKRVEEQDKACSAMKDVVVVPLLLTDEAEVVHETGARSDDVDRNERHRRYKVDSG